MTYTLKYNRVSKSPENYKLLKKGEEKKKKKKNILWLNQSWKKALFDYRQLRVSFFRFPVNKQDQDGIVKFQSFSSNKFFFFALFCSKILDLLDSKLLFQWQGDPRGGRSKRIRILYFLGRNSSLKKKRKEFLTLLPVLYYVLFLLRNLFTSFRNRVHVSAFLSLLNTRTVILI